MSSATSPAAPTGPSSASRRRRRLWDLFTRIHILTDSAGVVRISAQHEVNFLAPQV
jgi:hypothetical protein